MAYASDIMAPARAQRSIGFLAGLKAQIAQYRVYRKTLTELAALGDRELADLGLHRSQIRGIAWSAAYEAQDLA